MHNVYILKYVKQEKFTEHQLDSEDEGGGEGEGEGGVGMVDML